MTEQTQGVNYRALGDLFKLAEQRKGTFIYDIAVQMIEIYNEQVRDLLVTDGLNKRYPWCNHISVNLCQFLRVMLCCQRKFISLTNIYIRD